MSETSKLIKEIKESLSQTSASCKDELRVMRSMLNDKDYAVDIYDTEGVVGRYSPYEDARSMVSSIISSAAHVSKAEADNLAENYEFKKTESETLVNISKEFVNTYLQTGRKLPLGKREKSNVSLSIKEVEETTRMYPKKVGVNKDGSDRYEKVETHVPSYTGIKVIAPCPKWVKK